MIDGLNVITRSLLPSRIAGRRLAQSTWMGMLVSSPQIQVVSLSVHVDDINMSGKRENVSKMWAILKKKADLKDPTPLLDQENLGCTQREAQVDKSIVLEKQQLFTKCVNANTDTQLDESNKEETTAWSYDMQIYAQKCVEALLRIGAQKQVDQLHKVSTPCLYDHQIKPEVLESVGELSETCSFNCIGKFVSCSHERPDI